MADDSELTSDVVAVFADWDARDARQAAEDGLRDAIHSVLWNDGELAHHQAAEKTAQLLAGPLAPLLAKVQAVEALHKAWEDDTRDWYYENRHTHENGIEYVAGYEDGWNYADEQIARALDGER